MSDATPRTSAEATIDAVKTQLLELLEGGQAHATFEAAVKDFPAELRGTVPDSGAARLPYSAWQLIEHLRLAQRDILDFSSPPASGYEPKAWPKEYWPTSAEPPTPASWDETLAAIADDGKQFAALLSRPDVDLVAPFPWGEGQNLLREALLIADHSSYHTGELIVLRRLLGIWKP